MLSIYASKVEVLKSKQAQKYGIDNEPTYTHLENLKLTCSVFDIIRTHFGVPIFISSGYRSSEVNEKVGGSTTSQHSLGQALDIDADMYGKVTNKQLFDFIRTSLNFDQLIYEHGNDNDPAWVHFSYKRSGNRKQILRAYYDKTKGKTVYINWTPQLKLDK